MIWHSESVEKNRCSICGKKLKSDQFMCKYCGLSLCEEHHLPKNHDCHGSKIMEKGGKIVKTIVINGEHIPVIGIEHIDFKDTYSWKYFFRSDEEAERVYEEAKKDDTNIIEQTKNDKNIIDIHLDETPYQHSVTFVYKRFGIGISPEEKRIKRKEINITLVLIGTLMAVIFIVYVIWKVWG
jgi:hypothetical protein